MDNLKNDQYFVRKIQEDLAFIIKHMKNVDEEELAQKYGIPYNRPRFSARFWNKPTCPIHTLSTRAYNASWHLANVYAVSHMPLSRAI